MAATGRRSSSFAFAGLLFLVLAFPLPADESRDLRRRLGDVATALASGNSGQAMDCFDKDSFAGYEKLSGFFEGLTGAYQVDSQIEISDEESTDNEAKLTVHWSLTLTDPATNLDQHRDEDISVKFVRKKGTWRIVEFTPMDIFDPQSKRR